MFTDSCVIIHWIGAWWFMDQFLSKTRNSLLQEMAQELIEICLHMVTTCTKLNNSLIIQPINIKFSMWVSHDYEYMLMIFLSCWLCKHDWHQSWLISIMFSTNKYEIWHVNLLWLCKRVNENKMWKCLCKHDWCQSWLKFIMTEFHHD